MQRDSPSSEYEAEHDVESPLLTSPVVQSTTNTKTQSTKYQAITLALIALIIILTRVGDVIESGAF
jgi:hypothetical protein